MELFPVLVFALIAACISHGFAYRVEEWGFLTGDDTKVFDQTENHNPAQGRIRVVEINYPQYEEEETKNLISYIRVTNYISHGKPATANILFGGPEENHVGLLISSQVSAGIHSRIEIYETTTRTYNSSDAYPHVANVKSTRYRNDIN